MSGSLQHFKLSGNPGVKSLTRPPQKITDTFPKKRNHHIRKDHIRKGFEGRKRYFSDRSARLAAPHIFMVSTSSAPIFSVYT